LILAAAVATAHGADTPIRLRGTIEKVDATAIVVRAHDGEVVALEFADGLRVDELLRVDPNAIQEGTFVGTTAVPRAAKSRPSSP
jgi:hypothetical protein